MADTSDATAWLMLAAGEDREHGGNDGYADDPTAHYVWDDTVQNHRRPKVGDVIVLWDKKTLLGASVIDNIDVTDTEKTFRWCPRCGKSDIKARKSLEPTYKCYKCKAEFDEAQSEIRPVTRYTAHYEAGWMDLGGRIPREELRQLCVRPNSQNSIRELNYAGFRRSVGMEAAPTPVEAELENILGGHRKTMVRARIGQPAFRQDLLGRYGRVCAFTGPAPLQALEAAHLYSYAEDGVHRTEGGLLLRRDVHRLFDYGMLAVEPSERRIDVGPELRGYEDYESLHNRRLSVDVSNRQVYWLRRHWEIYR